MTRLGLISLALSVLVGVSLGSPRVRGEPLWKTREGDHNYRQEEYAAYPDTTHQATGGQPRYIAAGPGSYEAGHEDRYIAAGQGSYEAADQARYITVGQGSYGAGDEGRYNDAGDKDRYNAAGQGSYEAADQARYIATGQGSYKAGEQDTTRYVQLPTSVLNNLLADPELSPHVRQILSGNVPPQVVPIRPVPVQDTPRPKHQYNIQARPQTQSKPKLMSVPQPQFRPKPQSIPQYRPQTQSQPQFRPQVAVRPQAAAPNRRASVPTYIHAAPATPVRPEGNNLLLDAQIGHLLRSNPGGAQLIAVQPTLPALEARLPDNASLIRPDLVDTFRCDGLPYGYYADADNDCQVFHICLPLKQIYPANFTTDITYQFSFICPEYTIFSQDSMVCAWVSEAIPCGMAEALYSRNNNFFRRITNEDDGTERWATLNEPLEDEGGSKASAVDVDGTGDSTGDGAGESTGASTGDSAGRPPVGGSASVPGSAVVSIGRL